jgi:DNA-binding transcriptional LysR family regulator
VDLKKGEADLALRSAPIADDELVARKLCDAGWSLYASRAYLVRKPAALDLNDLRGHEVIGFDKALATSPAALWLEARTSHATVVMRSREMTEMVLAATSGVGLAVLPCVLADAEPALQRLTPDVVASRALSLVHRRELRLSANVRAVARFVVATIRTHERRIRGLCTHDRGSAP